jgi:hypothetical protein
MVKFFDMSEVFEEWIEPFTYRKISFTNDGYGKTTKVESPDISAVGFVRFKVFKELLQEANGFFQWQQVEIHTKSPLNLQNGDEIILQNKKYKILNCQDNSNYGFYIYNGKEIFDNYNANN